ncbi:Fanconi anemia group G protein [Megalops cyprinoides]|uniref:Fanconi anemia group G protein n=1 Tax=Megalops cyprinoides TaxID=118141 RepID=UPI001863C066|nr:Fanconi anemia group G protein [Megalops cyprinoides]
MDHGMFRGNCLDIWTEENNDIIKRWKYSERSQEHERQHDTRKRYYSEIHRLLQKIQGVPSVPAGIQLELTVLYNTLVFTLSLSQFTETGELLTKGIVRALEAVGCQAPGFDPLVLWDTALQTFSSRDHLFCLRQLLCVQWALWLSTGQLESIQELSSESQEQVTSPSTDLLAVIRDLRFSTEGNPTLSVAMAATELKELLHICTIIRKGIVKMEEGKDSEALLAFQASVSLPAPRTLLAQIHALTGICLAKLSRPQSALQCLRKALEVDFGCLSALYQSSLLYRQLGNARAEIEALCLLHAAMVSPACRGSSSSHTTLISPESLLGSNSLNCILMMPSPQAVLHSLAHRCLQNERVPEAVEHYLDLLASFQVDLKQQVNMDCSPALPRIPEIYLEATFAMLKAKRYWDSVAISEEVLNKTLDLIPERLVLQLPLEEHQGGGSTELSASFSGKKNETTEERLNCVLWAGAAYFFQGQAYSCLKKTTEAVNNFTRSINLLVKVQIKYKDWQCKDAGDGEAPEIKVRTLQRLKGLALAGRGVCFMARGQEKEALRDFQLSLQASPGMEDIELWLLEALWNLGRKEEAVAHWRRTQNSMKKPTVADSTPGGLPIYVQPNLQDGILFDSEVLKKKVEELIHSKGVLT